MSKVDDPTNILWENLDQKAPEKCARRTFVYFLIFLTMICTFALLIAANIMKPKNSNQCPQYEISLADAKESGDE